MFLLKVLQLREDANLLKNIMGLLVEQVGLHYILVYFGLTAFVC